MVTQRICIYCGDPARKTNGQGPKDHAIQRWVAPFLGVEGVLEHNRAVGVERVEQVRIDDYAGRFLCGACHIRINQIIEAPGADLVKRLYREQPLLLGQGEQALLAGWAAKTAYAIWSRMQKRCGVAIAHRRHLAAKGRAHPDVYVSVSRTTGERIRVIFSRTEYVGRDDGISRWYYDCVFDLAGVAFKVFGPGSGSVPRPRYKTPTSLASRLAPLTGAQARWPPGRLLDDDDVSRLFDHDPRYGKASP